MKHYELSDRFSNFIDSYLDTEFESFDLNSTIISELIYKHLVKIKASLWKQGVLLNRKKRISISDIFQDIIALYLKLSLGKDFEVILEIKVGKYQPDILIKYKGKNHFIIEIKTTIGWDRNSLNGSMQNRIENLSDTFQIPIDNVIYIFESPWNINKAFVEKYWNIEERKVKPLPTDFPYNSIRPLFTGTDPFYWDYESGFDKYNSYKVFSDLEIEGYSKNSVIVPLELTIREIIDKAKD